MNDCPCGSRQPLDDCCGRFFEDLSAPTALALMRARYTAYVNGNIDFIYATQQSSESDPTDREATEKWSRESEWLGLEIVSTSGGEGGSDTGTVEFVARYKQEGEEHSHHEEANFERRGGAWMLIEGKLRNTTFRRTTPKVGPNEKCPCGSGKKYKKCCGKP